MIKNICVALSLSLLSTVVLARSNVQYEVTITNITPGQTFTPQLLVTHPRSVQLFQAGSPASDSLEILAEDGNTGPITDDIVNEATDVQTIGGLLGPSSTRCFADFHHFTHQIARPYFVQFRLKLPTSTSHSYLQKPRTYVPNYCIKTQRLVLVLTQLMRLSHILGLMD